MLPSFMQRPFTRRRFPTINDHGTDVVNYSGVPDDAVFRGSIQPGAGTMDVVNRDGAEIVKTIWAEPNADVHHQDIITLNGNDYFVNGEPEFWNVGILDHTVIQLSRWLG